jgi:enoyl-CoA hydratase/carnithine racemase
MGEILSTIEDGVLTLRLRNGTANAMTTRMAAQLAGALSSLRGDVGAIVIAGTAGGTFCAGSDIRELTALQGTEEGPAPMLRAESQALRLLAGLPLPTLAAVDGVAYGGGMELAAACDFVIAGGTARFCLPEIKLGVFPGIGGTVWVPRRIGYARALEMMLTGQDVDAETAHRWNFANRVVAPGTAETAAGSLARSLAAGPREAVGMIKRSLRDAIEASEAEALAAALDRAIALGASPESREGLRAFAARVRPDFAAARAHPVD